MWRFLIPTFLLLLFGVFNLVGIKPYLVQNQLIYIAIAIVVFFIVKRIGILFFRLNSILIYTVFVVLFILTLLIGEEINGSRRWIDLYFFNFQTSEFFKVFAVMIVADFLARNQRRLNRFSTFVILLAGAFIPAFLSFRQPDLETGVFIIGIVMMICLFSEIPKRYILSLILAGAVSIPVVWGFLADYQKDRILSFVNPQIDPTGTAYNMAQSIITVGSGQFLGRGLGLGKQSTLFFLPENHTDFAFASLVEQFGFIGGLVVIVLYGLLAFLLIQKILRHMREKGEHSRFQFFYTIGFFTYFIFQVFVNIGMNLGITPVSGTALPLISFGGSSLLTWMIGLAFLSEGNT
jgi:rod shape determining protein RodA